MSTICKYAVRWGVIEAMPFTDIMQKDIEKVVRTITRSQAVRFYLWSLRQTTTFRNLGCAAMFTYRRGFRAAEVRPFHIDGKTKALLYSFGSALRTTASTHLNNSLLFSAPWSCWHFSTGDRSLARRGGLTPPNVSRKQASERYENWACVDISGKSNASSTLSRIALTTRSSIPFGLAGSSAKTSALLRPCALSAPAAKVDFTWSAQRTLDASIKTIGSGSIQSAEVCACATTLKVAAKIKLENFFINFKN